MNIGNLRVLVLGAALAVASSFVVASPSSATDDPGAVSISAARQSAATSYWTSQRLQAAVPGDRLMLGRLLTGVVGKVSAGLPRTIPGSAGTAPQAGLLDGLGLGGLGLDGLGLGGLLGGGNSANGGIYSGGGRVVKTTGKVFFTLDRVDYQCSGSSVKAKNKDLVVTAGHCVNAGPGAFATNFIFIPAYRNGSAPFGKFAARKLTTTTQWRTAGDLNYDVGIALVRTVGGKHLADVVGSQGVAFNQARRQAVTAFGYPAESPYDGGSLASCSGTTATDTKGSSDEGVNCNLNGGASGGPWYLGFDPATGIGITNSLNSFKYTGGLLGLGADPNMYGPYFGSVVQSLYTASQSS